MKFILAIMLALLASSPVMAAQARPLARDEAVEQRMIHITQDLRCLVCQNESLAASQAELARDLRNEVRGLIQRGYTDRQVVDYLVHRYGNYVRYRPPVDAETLPLWGGPFALLLVGLGALTWMVRSRARVVPAPLDPQAQARARALLARAEGESQ